MRARHCIKFAILLGSVSSFVYLYLYSTFLMQQHRGVSYGFKLPIPASTKANVTKDANISVPIIPLLTMFTTWPANDKGYTVRNNTLKNWANLKPDIRPVFFTSNMRASNDIIQHGWEVLPVSKSAASGIPVLKYMYLDVMLNYKSKFYAYANGDILFDEGLIRTLRTVMSRFFPPKNPILVIGQRTNVKNVSASEGTRTGSLSIISKQRGKLFMTFAEDYFITDSTFPWGSIPGIVIGRPVYDNWLVLNSCKHDHTVIDGTATILAVHQTTKAGNFEGKSRTYRNFNSGLLSSLYKTIKYQAGSTLCAPLVTKHNETGIYISQRRRFPVFCFHFYKSFGSKTKLFGVPTQKNNWIKGERRNKTQHIFKRANLEKRPFS